ncbi:MAG: hypothetical protein MSIBF_05635 [Candidatus Altiarchaeales archaeon IMC4]|nr:MAG: hypothetical protein MSIBF_05635 [Candidatus Altiarchaeales archaeon IMC4]
MRQREIIENSHDAGGVFESAKAELEKIIRELPETCPQAAEDAKTHQTIIDEIKPALLSETQTLSKRLSAIMSEAGPRAAALVSPQKTDHYVISETTGLSGRIDKVINNTPHLINTGQVPDKTDTGDKLRACAYAMLLEEETGRKVGHAVIEYARTSEQRPVKITEKLKQEVLKTRDAILSMAGQPPEICPHGQGSKCAECGFEDCCYAT